MTGESSVRVNSKLIGLVVRRLASVAGLLAVAPAVIIIVCLKPIVLIRFGTMTSNRIGHLAADMEAYVCARDRESPRLRRLDIIGCPEPICNQALRGKWGEIVRIWPWPRLWAFMMRSCQFWTGGDSHEVKLYDRIEDYPLILGTTPHLNFSASDLTKGRELLRLLGVPGDRQWVCVHNRDSAYLDMNYGKVWSYHDYRDFSVDSLQLASEELARRGYYILRMGAVVSEPFACSNPCVIDYATSEFRSDFGDLYLEAHCKFHLGANSGLCWLPGIFRRPVSLINVAPFSALNNVLCETPAIPKHVKDLKTQEYLSLREVANRGLFEAFETRSFEQAGVELVSNTPEEIRDHASEIDDRVRGVWVPHPEDEELQIKYKVILSQCLPRTPRFVTCLGANFLRENQYLLA